MLYCAKIQVDKIIVYGVTGTSAEGVVTSGAISTPVTEVSGDITGTTSGVVLAIAGTSTVSVATVLSVVEVACVLVPVSAPPADTPPP